MDDDCTYCSSFASSSWISSTADHPPVKMTAQFDEKVRHATGVEEDGYYEIDSDNAFLDGSAATLYHAPANMPAPAANMPPAVNPSLFNVDHLDPALFGFSRFLGLRDQPPQIGPINGAIPITFAYNNPGPVPTNGHVFTDHPGPSTRAIPITSAYNNPGPMPTNGHVLTSHPGVPNSGVTINHPDVPISYPVVSTNGSADDNNDDESPVSGPNNNETPLPLVPPGRPCRQVENRWYCGRCGREKSRKDEMRRHLRRDHYLEHYPGSFSADNVNYKEGLRRAKIDCP